MEVDARPWTFVVEAVVSYAKDHSYSNDIGKLREAALALDFNFGTQVRGRATWVSGARTSWFVVELAFHGKYRMYMHECAQGVKVRAAVATTLVTDKKWYGEASERHFRGPTMCRDLLAHVHTTIASGDLFVVDDPTMCVFLDVPNTSVPIDFPEDDDI